MAFLITFIQTSSHVYFSLCKRKQAAHLNFNYPFELFLDILNSDCVIIEHIVLSRDSLITKSCYYAAWGMRNLVAVYGTTADENKTRYFLFTHSSNMCLCFIHYI